MRLLKLPQTSDEFDTFWRAYPRREKKQAARDAFRWAMTHHNQDGRLLTRILETLAWQVAEARETRYWQMPDRWLLGMRWEDEAPVDAEEVAFREALRVAAELDAADAARRVRR
jgi:hypothetical protein